MGTWTGNYILSKRGRDDCPVTGAQIGDLQTYGRSRRLRPAEGFQLEKLCFLSVLPMDWSEALKKVRHLGSSAVQEDLRNKTEYNNSSVQRKQVAPPKTVNDFLSQSFTGRVKILQNLVSRLAAITDRSSKDVFRIKREFYSKFDSISKNDKQTYEMENVYRDFGKVISYFRKPKKAARAKTKKDKILSSDLKNQEAISHKPSRSTYTNVIPSDSSLPEYVNQIRQEKERVKKQLSSGKTGTGNYHYHTEIDDKERGFDIIHQ